MAMPSWLRGSVMPWAPPGVSQRHDAVAVSTGARALSPQAPLPSQPFGGAGDHTVAGRRGSRAPPFLDGT